MIFGTFYILISEGAINLIKTSGSRAVGKSGGFLLSEERRKVMILKIKANQVSKVHRHAKDLCVNCIDGNCLLLDDGEEHKCVQLLCISGIYCNYFKEAVLPAEKELYDQIFKQN